jgi:ubiquinone/menaquinone biosynthesis C-methylase UbiE
MSSPTRPGRPDSGEYFDERAERYDRAYDAPAGYALRSRLAAVLRLVGEGPGEVLDAGMGPGRLLAELARRDWTVSGIDASAEMVSAARSRLRGDEARLRHAKIELLPFADASFDVVVATGVLEYAKLEAAIRELQRVLRPGGLAVVSYPNPGNFYWAWRTHVWYRLVRAAKRILRQPPLVFPPASQPAPPARFRELVTAAGLEPERTEYTSFLVVPSPLDKLLPRTTQRLGLRLERNPSRYGRRFAGQVVYSARKP